MGQHSKHLSPSFRRLIADENAKARAARAAANAAVKAKPLPKSKYRWDKRRLPAKPPGDAELVLRARIAEQRQQRGPDETPALREAREAVEADWNHKREGTPRTHDAATRRQDGPLARLYVAGSIDAVQLDAAAEIASVAEGIAADVTVRTMSLETRIDGGGRDAGFEALGRVRREIAYGRWRDSLGHARAIVMAMVVGDFALGELPVGYSVAAKRYRVRPATAKAALIDALDAWPRIYGDVRREVDGDDVRRAWVRLA